MKRVVINFASGAWYPAGQQRLKNTMPIANEGLSDPADFIGVTTHTQMAGCPSHSEVPYAFKTFCLMYCKEQGYDQAIFADSSIWAVKSWKPVWDIIDDKGYYFEEAGHWSGTWTKDSVLNKAGITRDEAMKMPMFSAGFTGINFNNPEAMAFLEEWHSYACDGDSFKGTWDNANKAMSADSRCQGHRHDMSVASILACKRGMSYGRGGTFLAYIGGGYAEPNESAIVHLQPCC